VGIISAALGLLGTISWWPFSPWWALVPIGLLFIYGLLKANYQEFQGVEQQRDRARAEGEQKLERVRAEYAQELGQLTAERDALREEKHRDLQNERRKRVDGWRTAIRNFDFGADNFANTDTYSEMKPYLRGDVQLMFEWGLQFTFMPRLQGQERHRRTILDELARIEKEWGLV
jgi:hypothetical protein